MSQFVSSQHMIESRSHRTSEYHIKWYTCTYFFMHTGTPKMIYFGTRGLMLVDSALVLSNQGWDRPTMKTEGHFSTPEPKAPCLQEGAWGPLKVPIIKPLQSSLVSSGLLCRHVIPLTTWFHKKNSSHPYLAGMNFVGLKPPNPSTHALWDLNGCASISGMILLDKKKSRNLLIGGKISSLLKPHPTLQS